MVFEGRCVAVEDGQVCFCVHLICIVVSWVIYIMADAGDDKNQTIDWSKLGREICD